MVLLIDWFSTQFDQDTFQKRALIQINNTEIPDDDLIKLFPRNPIFRDDPVEKKIIQARVETVNGGTPTIAWKKIVFSDVHQVPEPSTILALLAFGGAGLLSTKKRTK